MRRLRSLKVLTSLALAAPFATLAAAADLPSKNAPAPAPLPPPHIDWTGFYAGVIGGGIWGSGSASLTSTLNGVPLGGLYFPSTVGSGTSGWLGGGEIGYNAQVGTFVWGVESDVEWVTNHKTVTVTGQTLPAPINDTPTTTFAARMNWLGTTRARIGFTMTPENRVLLFATGGVAYGGGQTTANATTPGGLSWSGSTGTTQLGWAAGFGGAYALTNNISLKTEYLYYNLGSSTFTATPNAAAAVDGLQISSKTSPAGSIARMGLDYKF